MRELSTFEDPLGATLRLGEDVYRVVGLLKDERVLGYVSKALAYDQKTSEIYVPFDTLVKREGTLSVHFQTGSRESTDVELSQVIVGVARVEDAPETARMIAALLESSHEQRDYEVVVPVEYLRQRKRTQDVFNYTFLAIAAISLLVGGIGIANIMLATVTERTKEIGIRRALGARRRDIVAQFLAETTLVAAIGGAVGVGAGFGFDWALRRLTGWTTIITAESVLVGLLVSMAVGVLSGIFPARRAADLDPIAALRRE
jgi:putative ABC transport system permease protein